MNLSKIKNKLFDKEDLSFEEASFVFNLIMNGKVGEIDITSILIALKIKNESKDEIHAAAKIMREKSTKIISPINAIDTCGTGGDGKNTLNISTASSLVLASMGIKVAKHGNKALTSKCGSADVLERLKININLQSDGVEKSIEKNNFGFMFAPNYHLTMKYVAPIRKKIGTRTIFNLLGPLSSPANVKKQIIGVFSKKWLLPFANALKNLESERAWIVHSEDGMDEISPFAVTNVVELKNNIISEFKIDPKKIGIKYNNPDNLKGYDADYNANKIIDIFSGIKNEFSEAVNLNSAAALIVCNKFDKFEDAYEFSKKHLDTDKALTHLKKIQAF